MEKYKTDVIEFIKTYNNHKIYIYQIEFIKLILSGNKITLKGGRY